jgi:hypothetical protein
MKDSPPPGDFAADLPASGEAKPNATEGLVNEGVAPSRRLRRRPPRERGGKAEGDGGAAELRGRPHPAATPPTSPQAGR